ncbi:phage late control D family protein [Niallia sp. 03190]|uniref:phage late control D family protein n=1 Tax=Niallia sp. 03190 TaxID=3458061 RepID=UPI004044A321
MNGRRISYDVKYNGTSITKDISPFITGLSFTDNFTGSADDISLNLADKERNWMGSWRPEKGATLDVALIISDGWTNSSSSKRKLGHFDVDDLSGDGPPSKATIKGISVPESSSLRGQKKTRSWEKTNFKKVVSDIAKQNGLGTYFQIIENPEYDRLDQLYESDGAFLYRIFNEAGFALKVANKKIYAIDESHLENKSAVKTINRTDGNVKRYSYKDTLNGCYKSCIVSYTIKKKVPDSTKGKTKIASNTFKHSFTPKKPPKTGRVLFVNEEVTSLNAAERLAKKSLRDANKDATTISITFTGLVNLYAGQTVNLKGFGSLNGKYIITTVSGSVGSGTETSIDFRKCLEGY